MMRNLNEHTTRPFAAYAAPTGVGGACGKGRSGVSREKLPERRALVPNGALAFAAYAAPIGAGGVCGKGGSGVSRELRR